MLPVAFQTPAAVVLVIGGLLSCFAGYRIFRVVLGIYGFILGALLASSAIGPDYGFWMIVAAFGGGLVGALILVLAYFVGVALLGAGIGAFVANVIWASLGREPHVFIVILFAVSGALGAMALQRYVIVGSTAFGGGLVGALILVLAYFVGVALLGAGIGAFVANVIWASLGREPHVFIVILFAVSGALGAMALQRYVIVGSTAFGGAWTTIVGAATLMGRKVAADAHTLANNEVWLAYPLDPAPGERWVLIAWLVLGFAGVIVQLTVTAKKKK